MSDLDALAAAVAAAPDDDLPRLVYADFIEEAGDAEYAKFIRDQVELARLPPWDPAFVRITRELPHWKTFADRLPVLGDGRALTWDDPPFRRGFGYAVRATFPAALIEAGDALFAAAPVGRLRVSTAPLADWQRIARCPWLKNLRELAFDGIETPVEPADVLVRSPHLTGLTGVEFGVADGPGMPIVVQRLLQSEVGRGLKSLALISAPRQPEEMVHAFTDTETRLETFRYRGGSLINWTADFLMTQPVLSRVQRFDLSGTRVERHWTQAIPAWAAWGELSGEEQTPADRRFDRDARSRPDLRALNLSGRSMNWLEMQHFSYGTFPGLRLLDLSGTRPDRSGVADFVSGQCWLELVDLDLSDNRLSDFDTRLLLTAAVPPELERLALYGNEFSAKFRDQLRSHFGDRVQLEHPGEPGA